MDHPGALEWLDRHINREATAGRIAGLSLEPMQRLVHVLGDPQHAYPVVHITGTNGKGSVARLVTALLAAHGLTVGTYTSPHLQTVNERLAIDGVSIDDDTFAEVIGDLASLVPLSGLTPSYFELLTAAAFSWFAHSAVDVAVVEVGLLGRWDATNVADAQVAVITNIGPDHTDFRGDWRAAIAAEKVGIVKPASFLVLGETDLELRPLFVEAAADRLWVLDEDFVVDADQTAVGGHLIDLRTPGASYPEVFLPLHGAHQVTNAALAVAATEAFFARPLEQGVVELAFEQVRLPARFEVVSHQPLTIIDGAHNPDGAVTVAETLDDEFDIAGRRLLVVGLLEGRDPTVMLEAFDATRADLLVACTPPSPRALPAAELAAAADALGIPVRVVPDVADAVRRARAEAEEGDAVVIAGSLYVAGAARTALGLPPP
ncbi:MAG: Mur ligase family protein [Acidimicrobiales bacterium]|nr:Mur ligase family protein [Acidimicrobiales bacterium]